MCRAETKPFISPSLLPFSVIGIVCLQMAHVGLLSVGGGGWLASAISSVGPALLSVSMLDQGSKKKKEKKEEKKT